METSLHRSLKQIYSAPGSRTEAVVHGYRADVLQGDLVVEIQASPLGAISRKIEELLRHTRVLVVKPITRRKYLVRRDHADSEAATRRLSPKKGKVLDVFDDLVRFTRVFPHPNLTIEVLLVDEEEHRITRPRRYRRPDYIIQDRCLLGIEGVCRLRSALDLAALLPAALPDRFTSDVLAAQLNTPAWFARKVAYTLRHCGASRLTGKVGNRLVYEMTARNRPAYRAAG